MYLIKFIAMKERVGEKGNTLDLLSDIFNNHRDKPVYTANRCNPYLTI